MAGLDPQRKPPRLRLIAPVVAEVDLQAALCDALDKLLLPGVMWTSLPIGHVKLTGQQAARLARIGTHTGWPDVILLHAGTVFGLELKRVGGQLSRTRMVRTRSGGHRLVEGQCDTFPRLMAAGMRIACVSSVTEALTALSTWGVPLRRFS
jgi:hypothetical protein